MVIDSLTVVFSIWSCLYSLDYHVGISSFNNNYSWIYLISLIAAPVIYYTTKQYKALSRYAGLSSVGQVFVRNILLYLMLFYIGDFFKLKLPSASFWYLTCLFTSLLIIFTRLTIRDFLPFFRDNYAKNNELKVVIYGAGLTGAQLARNLRLLNSYKLLFFIDDNPKLWGRTILGACIHPPQYITDKERDIDQVLLAIPSLKGKKRKEILESLQKYQIPVLTIPSIEQLVSGQAKIDSLKPISIHDLLGRDVVIADPKLLGQGINNKVVLVTGAGGSIGSELCRQIFNLDPKKLILLDSNESCLYLINQELSDVLNQKVEFQSVLGNACDYILINKIFNDEKVDVVFHAAAYKHVPLVELNPIQGLYNNVISTRTICACAEKSSVKQVVFVSTDKAVRPTNIMGASKRLSELIIQAYSEKTLLKAGNDDPCSVIFSMVRFGNVLDSSGSVVRLFRNQISRGGPITLTNPNIIRYFMTIPEASQLVLQSLALAKGGDVFLLDMGEPVLIRKLAEQMIELSGYSVRNKINPEGDIEIVVTGLRPGEKLYEELLIDENSSPTDHPLIYRANEKAIPFSKLLAKVDELELQLKDYSLDKSLKILSEIVPEWKRSDNLI